MFRYLKRGAALIAALLLFAPFGAVSATALDSSAESCGYIICLTPEAGPASVPDGAEEIWRDAGLYRVDSLEGLGELVSSGAVSYAEPNYTVRLDGFSDDSLRAQQWNLDLIGAEAAHELGYTGAGVRIAVIDSGIYAGHEELQGVNIETGLNLMDGSTDTDDETGHGTFVSGVIAAASGNGVGIAGICEGVTLVPFKCFGGGVAAEVSDIVSAVYRSVSEYNCDVINLSLGSENDSFTLHAAIDVAEKQGAIVCSAVGNSGTELIYYPAAYETVVGVGSVGNCDAEQKLLDREISEFSQRNSSVFVCAPGASITSIGQDDHYYTGSGTSFATPHVSATAALALSAYPELSPAQFRELLIKTSTDMGEVGYDVSYGWGVINAALLVEQAAALREADEAATGDMQRFAVDEKLYSGFADVDESLWYGAQGQGWIKLAVSLGIMNGKGDGLFFPEGEGGSVLISEAVKMAAVVRSIYTGDYDFDQSRGEFWYSTYVDYALAQNIILDGDFADYGLPATRAQMAYIFSRALPEAELAPINDIGLEYIPDVDEATPYCGSVLLLYRAGVLTGYAQTRAFSPDNYVSRAESAAIISRLALLGSRVGF